MTVPVCSPAFREVTQLVITCFDLVQVRFGAVNAKVLGPISDYFSNIGLRLRLSLSRIFAICHRFEAATQLG